MLQVSVTDLKNKLSYYLRLVKEGESVQILERAIPVACLQRIEGQEVRDDERVESLARAGLIRAGKRESPLKLLKKPLVPCKGNAVKALIEERDER